jgi:hypothetical protein
MNNVILLTITAALMIFLLVRFVVILIHVRRGSAEMLDNWGLDSASLFTTLAGGVALGLLLTSDNSTEQSYLVESILLVSAMLLLLIPLFILPRKTMIKMIKSGFTVDERIVSVGTKSSRNALFITYLEFIGFIITNTTIDRNALMVVLASGLLTFFISYFFYYYRRS